jgi:PhzF family phenazine biosynthesis protein
VALPIQVVDAFTAAPFRGNPAAVVLLDAAADDTWMQSVAAEMKHSETAFLEPRAEAEFGLRWFTPAVEVDLCGHATLASAHALWDWGVLDETATVRFATRSGELLCRPLDDLIEMDFPASPSVAADAPAGLFDALAVEAAPTFANDSFVLVELPTADAVRAVAPDFRRLADVEARGVIVTAAGDDYDVVSRMFAPRVGIDEDPVTGAAHCMLAPHWAERLGPELVAHQASARGGVVHTRLDGDRVALAGEAVTVLRGDLEA